MDPEFQEKGRTGNNRLKLKKRKKGSDGPTRSKMNVKLRETEREDEKRRRKVPSTLTQVGLIGSVGVIIF